MIDYDICIIGAGISGLYSARELSKALPDAKICILEKYEFLGGRASTFKKSIPGVGPVQWEAGAGRIHSSHKETLELLKEYNLELIPIDPGISWISDDPLHPEPVEFGRYLKNLGLSDISPEILRKTTLKQVLEKTLGKQKATELTDRYEYRSEIDTMRADKAIEALSYEIGYQEGFFVVKEGFSSLVGALKRDVQSAGVKILRSHEVKDIHSIKGGYTILVKDHIPIRASKVIVAITRDAVADLPCFKGLHILKQVKMRPLVRMYAVFPLVNGKVWFDGIHKFVCPKPLRFVLPMNPQKGTIMITYTDGKDAEYWLEKMKSGNVEKEVMIEIRKIFPNLTIPDPLYFKIHDWADGCSYWTPGSYKIQEASMASIIPLPDEMPNVYFCNESWAECQSWVNSSIEQSNLAIKAILENQ